MHGVAVVAVDGGLEHEDLQWLKILGNKNPEGCIGRLFYKTEKILTKLSITRRNPRFARVCSANYYYGKIHFQDDLQ